jgi:hypothetical protein
MTRTGLAAAGPVITFHFGEDAMQTKLKLNLEDLAVDTFDTTRSGTSRGTVFGEQCTCWTACGQNSCPGCPTCDASCNGTCDASCNGTCAASCNGTCGDSCWDTCGFTCEGRRGCGFTSLDINCN